MAVEATAGGGFARRRVPGSRDSLVGICLLAVALGAAFAVRAATGTHARTPVRTTIVGAVVQAPVSVVTTNQIPAAPALQLPKVTSHPKPHVAPQRHAAVKVTTTAAVSAPVTHSTTTPPASTGDSSGTPTVSSGSTGSTGSATGSGTVSPPSTSGGTSSGTHGSGAGTSSGTSSGSSGGTQGSGSSGSSGTVSGGG